MRLKSKMINVTVLLEYLNLAAYLKWTTQWIKGWGYHVLLSIAASSLKGLYSNCPVIITLW